MRFRSIAFIAVILLLLAGAVAALFRGSFISFNGARATAAAGAAAAVDYSLPAHISFNEDIQPILSDNCYFCHGQDTTARKANLRVDREEFAFLPRASGQPVIVKGHPEGSALIRRISSTDPNLVMPPPASHKQPLTGRQVALITRWVQQGAKYEEHWAFVKPARPPLPAIKEPSWVRNPIDSFVLAKLEANGLTPNPEADRRSLIRRVTLDLTGLPPAPEAVTAFLADTSTNAFEKVVDRLLASPHYAENEARYWLDAARYADTVGLHIDQPRSIYPYRDWVIRAFDENKPFDQFVTEQVAGDMLPHPTMEQQVATGFTRCGLATSEGGSIADEVLANYARDDVETHSMVFMGLTMGCCACHDHKFDPISQKEFYQFSAFFRNTTEPALSTQYDVSVPPYIRVPAEADRARWAVLSGQMQGVRQDAERASAAYRAAADQLARNLSPFIPARLQDPSGPLVLRLPVYGGASMDACVLRRAAADVATLQRKEAAIEPEYDAIKARSSITMVMDDKPSPPFAYFLKRGQYDQKGEKVSPGVPKVLGLLGKEEPANRLGLAKWYVSPDNPLLARVTVNRFWQQFFGIGIVRTSENFGVMGDRPVNQPLLDWMAVEFRESGWDVKHMLKLMVMSAAYRQADTVSPEKLEKDPENRLLSRGPRFRLDAEVIRDQALAASGLLNLKIGGPSAKPYEPPGLWEAVSMRGNEVYTQDHGDALYRRSMYTYLKRLAPQPQLTIFDATSREVCTVRRDRTDTPLQALAMENDPQYMEAARHLAANAIHSAQEPARRLDYMAEHLLARPLAAREQALLLKSVAAYSQAYAARPDAAAKVIHIGDSLVDATIPAPEQAAYTMVASELLNLDETLNK